MIKSLKKLKIWSRRKKKKKTRVLDQSPPPYPTHCCSCSSASPSPSPSPQPSAPPLPPWLDFQQSYNVISPSGVFHAVSSNSDHTISEVPVSSSAETVSETTPLYTPQTIRIPSYQQYTVSDPVYGVPILPPVRTEKSAGIFGCVVGVGANLIRCFCPCFHFKRLDC